MNPLRVRRVALVSLAAIASCASGFATNSREWEYHLSQQWAAKQAAAEYSRMRAESAAASARNTAMWDEFARERARSAASSASSSSTWESWGPSEEQLRREREAAEEAERRAKEAARKVEEARARRQAWEEAVHASPEAALTELDRNGTLSDDDRSQLLTYWATRDNIEATFRLALFELKQGRRDSWISNLKKAADAAHPVAMARLGDAYLAGDGVATDPDIAEALYRSAARAGAAGGFTGLANLLQARATGNWKDEADVLLLRADFLPQGLGDDRSAIDDRVYALSDEQRAAAFGRLGEAFLAGKEPFPRNPGAAYAFIYVASAVAGGESFNEVRERLEHELDPEVLGRAMWALSRGFESGPLSQIVLDGNTSFSLFFRDDRNDFEEKARALLRLAAEFGSLDAQLKLAADWEKFAGDGSAGAEWAWFYYSIALLSPGRTEPNPVAQQGLERVMKILNPLQRRHGAFLVGEFFDRKYGRGGKAPLLAELWYRHAAALEDADAMYRLSSITAARSSSEAADWKRRAAAAGSFDALIVENNVKEFLDADPGVFVNVLGWLCFYADEGNDVGMLRLADLYEHRAQSPSDLVCAYRWLVFLEWRLKEQKFWYDGFYFGGEFDERGRLPEDALPGIVARRAAFESRLNPGQRALALEQLGEWFHGLYESRFEGEVRIRFGEVEGLMQAFWDQTKFWFEKAAEAGSPTALHRLGDMLAGGPNKEEALVYFRKAAALGAIESTRRISEAYLDGNGVARDPVEAQAWDWLADPTVNTLLELGPEEMAGAKERYAELCESGREFPRDPVRLWALRAAMAATGDSNVLAARQRDVIAAGLSHAQMAQAQFSCYQILLWGEFGVAKNDRAARAFLQQAAEAGHPEAEREFASAFRDANADGPITQQEYDHTVLWLQRAIDHSDALACTRLASLIRAVDQQNASMPDSGRIRIRPGLTMDSIARLDLRAAELGSTSMQSYLAGIAISAAKNKAEAQRGIAQLRTVARKREVLERFMAEHAQKELAEHYSKGTTAIDADWTHAYLWYSAIGYISDDSLDALRGAILQMAGETAVERLVALTREIRIVGLEYLD